MTLDDMAHQKMKIDDKHITRIRICFLGSKIVGKTAIVVRYLTKRFINEYNSGTDMLYKKTILIDDIPCQLEIVDTSNRTEENSFPTVHVRWADACVVVYSIRSRPSFQQAVQIIETIQKLKEPLYLPILLLANQKDLEHYRKVPLEDGQALALENGCHFGELSAAENIYLVTLTLDALCREVRALKSQRTAVRQRRSSLINVSKLINSLIGRNNHAENEPDKILRTISTMPLIHHGPEEKITAHEQTHWSNKDYSERESNAFKSLKKFKKRPSFSL